MSYKIKRVMSLMIAIFVAFGMMAVGTGEANAASSKVNVFIGIRDKNQVYVGEQAGVGVSKGENFYDVKSVKVSKKAIAKVKKYTYKDEKGKKHYYFNIIGKKPGKTKVTVKYKVKKKVKSKKVTVTVNPYPNPIQSLTVNGKSIATKGNNRFFYYAKCGKSKTEATIKLVPAEGWSVMDSTYGYVSNNKTGKEVKGMKGKILNGKKISFPKKYKYLYVTVEMQNETGEYLYYEIGLNR